MAWLVSEGMWPCALPRRTGRTPSAEMRTRRIRSPGGGARRVEARQGVKKRDGNLESCVALDLHGHEVDHPPPQLYPQSAQGGRRGEVSRHACPGSRGQARRPRSDSGTGHSFRASPVRLASWLLSVTHSCRRRFGKDSSEDGAWLSSSPSPSSPVACTTASRDFSRWILTWP